MDLSRHQEHELHAEEAVSLTRDRTENAPLSENAPAEDLAADNAAITESGAREIAPEYSGNGEESLGLGSYNAVPDASTDVREQLSHSREEARKNPRSMKHLAELAESYAAADLPHKALQQYHRALELGREQGEEETPDTHLGIGDLCRTFAMSAAAVRSYERAVRLSPKRPFYRWKLAIALAALGLYERAAEQMQKAVELSPADSYYRFQLADIYLLMNRDDDAVAMLRDVVALSPRDDYYHLRLGAALLRTQQTEEALPHFQRAAQLKPDNASYRTLLRYAAMRDGREPAIAVDVDTVELSAYDEDFVKRIQKLAQAA